MARTATQGKKDAPAQETAPAPEKAAPAAPADAAPAPEAETPKDAPEAATASPADSGLVENDGTRRRKKKSINLALAADPKRRCFGCTKVAGLPQLMASGGLVFCVNCAYDMLQTAAEFADEVGEKTLKGQIDEAMQVELELREEA